MNGNLSLSVPPHRSWEMNDSTGFCVTAVSWKCFRVEIGVWFVWQYKELHYPWASAAVATEKKPWFTAFGHCSDHDEHDAAPKSLGRLKVLNESREPPPPSLHRVSAAATCGADSRRVEEEEHDDGDDVSPRWRAGRSQAPGGKRSWILWRGDPGEEGDGEHIPTVNTLSTDDFSPKDKRVKKAASSWFGGRSERTQLWEQDPGREIALHYRSSGLRWCSDCTLWLRWFQQCSHDLKMGE